MRFARLVCLCGLLAAPVAPATADDPKPAPSAEGTVPSTFRSYVVTDQRTDAKDTKKKNFAGKIHCLVLDNGLNPTLAAFVRTPPKDKGDPAAVLTGEMKRIADKYRDDEFGAFVQFLLLDKEFQADPARDDRAGEIDKWAKEVAPGRVVLALHAKDGDDVRAWGIGEDDITVVFYHRQKVVRKWPLKADGVTPEVLKEIAATVEKQLGGK